MAGRRVDGGRPRLSAPRSTAANGPNGSRTVSTVRRGYVRHELRSGTFARELPLPEGASDADVVATYTDGILEIRVPVATVTPPAATKVPVTKS